MHTSPQRFTVVNLIIYKYLSNIANGPHYIIQFLSRGDFLSFVNVSTHQAQVLLQSMPLRLDSPRITRSDDSDCQAVAAELVRVGGKYRLRQMVGSGSFGVLHSFCMCNSLLEPIVGLVYLAVDIFSRQEVAVKLEHASAHTSQLQNEYEVYKSLAGGAGIPAVRWFRREGDYNALVLECLGPSLEVIFSRCNYKFSLKTVLLLADQLVQTFTMFRRLTARILT